MVAGLALGVVEIIAGTGGNSPPICVALILPIGITGISGETEHHLIAVVVVPVKGGIPTVSHGILAVIAIDNLLCYCGTLVIFLLTNIHLGI